MRKIAQTVRNVLPEGNRFVECNNHTWNAADVTTAARHVLNPDEPVARASKIFSTGKDDCIPVVTEDSPQRLVGIVRRRDVLRLLIRERSS